MFLCYIYRSRQEKYFRCIQRVCNAMYMLDSTFSGSMFFICRGYIFCGSKGLTGLIGWSKGGARDAPRTSKFFQFHAVFGEIWPNCVLAPPPRGNPGSATGTLKVSTISYKPKAFSRVKSAQNSFPKQESIPVGCIPPPFHEDPPPEADPPGSRPPLDVDPPPGGRHPPGCRSTPPLRYWLCDLCDTWWEVKPLLPPGQNDRHM